MQNNATFVLSPETLTRLLEPNILSKGQDYQQKGWVHNLKINSLTQELSAEVQGKSQPSYTVRVRLKKHPKSGLSNIEGVCSCYQHYNCKHVAAALLHYVSQSISVSVEESKVLNAQSLQSRFLSSPPSRLSASQSNAHWLSFLNTIEKSPGLSAEKSVPKQTLIYTVDCIPVHPTGFALELNLKWVNTLKKGGYGAQKPYSSLNANNALLSSEDKTVMTTLRHMRDTQGLLKTQVEHKQLLTGPLTQEAIKAIIATGRAYWKKLSGPRLALGPPLKGEFRWELLGDGLQQLRCHLPNKTVLASQPLWYLDNKLENNAIQMGLVETKFDDETAAQLMSTLPFSFAQAKLFYDTFSNLKLPKPTLIALDSIKGVPHPVLSLVPHRLGSVEEARESEDDSALAVLSFQYKDTRIEAHNKARTIEYYQGEDLVSVQRDFDEERVYLNLLKSMQVAELETLPLEGTFCIKIPFIFHDLPKLRAQNWVIETDPEFPLLCVEEESWYTNLEEQSQYDWFAFELGIMVEGKKINILPLLVNLIEKNPQILSAKTLQTLEDTTPFYLQLPDNRYIEVLAGRLKDILSVLVELYDSTALHNGVMKMHGVQVGQLLGLQQSLEARWLGGENLKALGEQLLHFEEIKPCVLPKGLKGQLRDYQKEGVDWLNFLRQFKLGGILADDMGLGKTIQVLTHLLAEKESGRQKGPNLIIAPTSLMANWESEANRFTPDLKVLVLQGSNRQTHFEEISSADIVLTTYPLINRDKSIFLEHTFHYLILDEAQYIKNPYTKAYQALLDIQAKHTLCMTGTPMENHLGELWALFHFAVPGLLGDNRRFKRIFRDPIEKEGDISRQKSLANRLRPFMLRRTKEQVATELPAKTEIIHRIELEGAQLDLYESIRLAMQQKVVQAVKQKGFTRSQILILDALLKLRQTCNDPRLLSFETAKSVHHSAKRVFLMEMLDTLIEEGRKVLLFSSFATMLDLLEVELKEKNIAYVKLTGKTQNRAEVINLFQEGSIPVMLITLKAGGVGLNLTAADTVIHYDPWWNPAAEAQATDRAHRLGQTKPVFVYKLVCKGTVEEKILKMQENKKRLLTGVFKSGENQSPKLSAKDIAYLFEPILE